MDQNLLFRLLTFFHRAFDCNVHVDVADGSLFVESQRLQNYGDARFEHI